MFKNTLATRNYTITCYQTLEEVPWLLRLDQPAKSQKLFKKIEKLQVL